MHRVKSHKTVEQIAKKHRIDVSFVKKQLEMGIPIEHEHTKDKDLATDIALQHLDEIPDYYTRLKKMEADAKKQHKKYKDVVEELDKKSAKDPGYSLRDWFKGGGWVQTGGKYDGKPCAKQPGQTTKPFCRDPDDRAAMSKKERNRRSAKKRKEDPNPNRTGAAKIVTKEQYIQEKKGEKDACYNKVKSRYKIWPSAYASGALSKCRKVGADNWGTKSEDCWDGYKQEGMKKKGKKMVPNCVPVKEEQAMIRYCPKCKKDETRSECRYGEKYWDMFSIPSALTTNQLKYDVATVHPGNFPESYDHEHSMARSELSTIVSAAKRLRKKMKGEGNIEAWVQSKITKAADYLDAAADYVDSGEMREENVSIQDIDGNNYVDFIDIIKPEPLKASKGLGSKILGEGPSFEVGGGKLSSAQEKLHKMSPSQRSQLPSQMVKKLVGVDLPPLKASPSSMVKTADSYEPTGKDLQENPLIGLGIRAGLGAGTALAGKMVYDKAKDVAGKIDQRNKKQQQQINQILGKESYLKTFKEFMSEAKKSEMKCNSPKSEPVGDSLTGKSHVVKACEGGKEKLIRFGQRGVKGSPKKKGESKEYASRRHRFQTRHAKNIAKGKMSAAYWANKVKW